MSDEPVIQRRRWRPRFSLLTAILLMTIVGVSIVMARLWNEVGPLREENRRMRSELGLLTIEDSAKAYAISMPTIESNTWRWRIYLPPGAHYALHESSGHLPAPGGKDWFTRAQQAGTGGTSSGSSFEGEFLLDAQVIKDKDQWVLATKATKRDGNSTSSSGGKSSIHQPNGDWLSDGRSQITSSDVSPTQKEFDLTKPILLLHVQRPVITELPGGGHSSQSPQGAADGFAIWIAGRPPGAPAKQEAVDKGEGK